MLGRYKVGMRAIGALGGKLEHFGSQRRQNSERLGYRRNRIEGRRIHGIQISAHSRNRLFVPATSKLFNEGSVAYAEAKDKTIGIRFRQRILCGSHRHRTTSVNVGDACRDGDMLCTRQEYCGISQRFASRGFRQPDCAEAELLKLCSSLRLGSRLMIQLRRPYAMGPVFSVLTLSYFFLPRASISRLFESCHVRSRGYFGS